MPGVLVRSVQVSAQVARFEPESIAAALRVLHEQHEPATCLCVDPPRRLVVRNRLGRLHLAVWPEDGHRHEPTCTFFRSPAPDDETPPSSRAIVELEEGTLDVQLEIELSRGPGGDVAEIPEGTLPTDRTSRRARQARPQSRQSLALHGLMNLLWALADLNRWMPGWTRDYWRVHRQLTLAAGEVQIGDTPLINLLLVLRAWRETEKAAIEEEWARFEADLQPDQQLDGSVPSRLLLGEVVLLEESRHGFRLRLRHLRPSIYFDAETHLLLQRNNLRAAAAVPSKLGAGTSNHRVMGLLQVEISKRGNLRLVTGTLALVSELYLPISNEPEARLVGELVHADRNFACILPVQQEVVTPYIELRDTDVRVAIIVSVTRSSGRRAVVADQTKRLQAHGMTVVQWTADNDEPMPRLPAASERSAPR